MGEEEPFVQWTKEVRRTTGMDAGPEGYYRDVLTHRAFPDPLSSGVQGESAQRCTEVRRTTGMGEPKAFVR